MNENKKITCINCPVGCTVIVNSAEGEFLVSGNECKRGEEYALQEYHDPRRVLTGTVTVTGAALPRLPVKTDNTIPKALVPDAAAALSRIAVQAPVRCGAIIQTNFAENGVNLIATRDLGVRS